MSELRKPTQHAETPIRILHEPTVRVSMAILGRVKDQDLFCVIKNYASSRAAGRPILTPIGGGIHGTPEGLSDLERRFGVDPQTLDKGVNLRFVTEGNNAGQLRTWFMNRAGRETSVERELVDELAQKNLLVPELYLEGAQYTPGGYYAEFTPPRPGRTENTLRLVEVSDVVLPDPVMDLLHVHAARPVDQGWVRFVTPAEIEQCQTTDGIEIGTVTKALTHSAPYLPIFR